MNYRIMVQRAHDKERFSTTKETDAAIMDIARRAEQRRVEQEQPDKVEVAIGRRKTATFYREAGEVLLECDLSAFYLDREEAYRLLSLLEAEFKGSVE